MTDYTLHCGDCLDIMPTLEAGSIDAIICDPPYGTTACKWDSVIPFAPMWECIKHLIKPRGAVVLFGGEPFSSLLRCSNLDWYKYDWVWRKTRPFDIFNCKNKPLRIHENICVFSGGTVANGSGNRMVYNPQGLMKVDKPWKRPQFYKTEHRTHRPSNKLERVLEFEGYPQTVIDFANSNNGTVHPTQKPVDLMVYLIRTYTNPGETVLDFTMGSGSTGVAAIQEGRRFVGIEKDAGYFEIAQKRISETTQQPALLEAA